MSFFYTVLNKLTNPSYSLPLPSPPPYPSPYNSNSNSPDHRSSLSSPSFFSPPTSSGSSRPLTASAASPTSPAPAPQHQHQPQAQSQAQSRSRFGGLPFDAFNIGHALRSSYASPAPPAPPSVSRPVVGYGVFSSSSTSGSSGAGAGSGSRKQQSAQVPPQQRRAVSQQEFEREYELYGEDGYAYGGGYGYGYHQPQPQQPQQPPLPQLQPRLQEEVEEDGYDDAARYSRPQQQKRRERTVTDDRARGSHRQHHQSPQQQQHQQGQSPESGLAKAIRRGSSEGGAAYGYPNEGQEGPQSAGRGIRGGSERANEARKLRNRKSKSKTRRRRENNEVVAWARWDVLNANNANNANANNNANKDSNNDRRVLVLAYPSTLQIWDCKDLKEIREVLCLDFGAPEWALLSGGSTSTLAGAGLGRGSRAGGGGAGAGGEDVEQEEGDGDEEEEGGRARVRVVHAAVLPPPRILPTSTAGAATGGRKALRVEDVDAFRDVRPLLGILLEPAAQDQDPHDPNEAGSTTFVLYSLRTHQIVKMLALDGRAVPTGAAGVGEGFVGNEFVVVVGTTSPARIYVLSALTFQTLHVVQSEALEPFHRPAATMHATQHSISSTLGVPSALSPSTSGSGSSQPSVSSTGLLSMERSRIGGYDSSSAAATATAEAAPYPVFALSHRLLAYASPSPGSSSSSSPSAADVQPSSSSSSNLFGALTSKARRRLSSSSNATSASASASGPSSSHGGASSSVSSSPFGGLGVGLGGAAAGIGKLTGMSSITQADVGHAALKVGESVLGGMRFLGGLAVEAAKSRVGGGPAALGGGGSARPVSVGSALGVGGGATEGGGGRFVSRSAPDNVAEDILRDREGRYPAAAATATTTPTTPTTVAPQTRQVAEQGYYVTVLDLAPILLASDPARDPRLSPSAVSRSPPHAHGQSPAVAPRKVDEFLVSRSQPVAGLSFSEDGNSIGVIPRDGHSVKVFKLNPAPGVMVSAYNRAASTSSSSALSPSSPEDSASPPAESYEIQVPEPLTRPPNQVYDLYRGRTSAVIESVEWSREGKWVGVGTRNRTVHVFGVNPFGMKPDVVWHLGGRVRDGAVSGIEPRMSQLTPLVRIRASKNNVKSGPSVLTTPGSSSSVAAASEPSRAPLVFIFVPPSELSSNIQSPNSPRHHPGLPSFSPTLSPSSPTFSPPSSVHGHSGSRPSLSRQHTSSSSYQDVLLFDPADGVLSLRRLTLDKHPVKEGGMGIAIGGLGGSVGAAAAHALGVTSISLPGMGGAGRLSTSPSAGGGGSGVGRDAKKDLGADIEMELIARESTVVWWDLKRDRNGRGQIKIAFEPPGPSSKGRAKAVGGADWLAHGEISTCSSSPAVLPRSLYLSHQFSFHTLGEDYHALLRRYQFDIKGDKIEVRKEVEVVSAFSPTSAGAPGPNAEAFVQDFDQIPHRHARRVSSSFDEPLASAISHSLHLDSASLPLILPMYPNGVPGSAPGPGFTFPFPQKVLRNAIPIGKGIGRNVNVVVGEGIGRFVGAGVGGKRGRERGRGRGEGGGGGYSLSLNEDDGLAGELHVPLEFDEEDDEDFIGQDGLGQGGLQVPGSGLPLLAATSESSRDTSLATPGSSSVAHSVMMDADVVGRVDEEIWGDDLSSAPPSSAAGITLGGHRLEGSLEEEDTSTDFFARGWDRQDRMAVEEQERYDDLGVVGVGGRLMMREKEGVEEGEREREKERKRKGKTRKR